MGFSKKSTDNRAAASAPASAPAPAPAPASASLDEPSTSTHSFFSRFTLPLRSRTRNIADFHIRPAEPHRKYGAGDHVQGAVILTVVKPVRITHLVVSLHGYVRVYKGPNAPANEPIVDPTEIPTTASRSARQKGHASGYVRLFQDEQTLSADGRLEPGRYEFNFDLLFPTDGLPSSIDFERGTISYMITATLTRPTSIGTKTPPKTSCERKIYLVEKVDIGPLAPPRTQTIHLEPVSKRSKRKRQPATGTDKGSVVFGTAEPASDPDAIRVTANSAEGSLSVTGEDQGQEDPTGNSRTPVSSDGQSVSSDSAISFSTGRSRSGDTRHAVTANPSPGVNTVPAVKERTITATVEVLKGGCLPGDVVPIKISVQHIRRIKSLHGVIVTLYRLGRIDSSPVLLSKELRAAEARRPEKEDYYPKSKTGLGGLSLSAAGSCSVFRKDLSQVFAPLIIDPDTLTASLTTSVRVPEDVFPTIKGVPFEMVTFKYHIEMIVDLGGKLANQIQGIKPSSTRLHAAGGPLGMTGSPHDGGAASLTSWGTSIIDTDRLRRQKGVISVAFEVVVGTADSSRLRGKDPVKPISSVHTVPFPNSELYDSGWGPEQPWPTAPEHGGYTPDDYPQDYVPPPLPQRLEPYPYWNATSPQPPSAPHYVPPPDVPDESTLDEKDRIRLAEQQLLPSQPPEPPLAGPSYSHPLATCDNLYDADDQIPTPVPPHNLATRRATTQPDPLAAPSAPTLEDLSPGRTEVSPTEDKQELERRRLLAEASAPPELPEDHDNSGGGSGGSGRRSATELGPSAPVLEDVDEEEEEEEAYGPQYAYGRVAASSSRPPGGAAEPLPRYER
ncbi:hypothetical protein VTK56DRAFT_3301 [Thermocarpiscus australiensis]